MCHTVSGSNASLHLQMARAQAKGILGKNVLTSPHIFKREVLMYSLYSGFENYNEK